MSMWILILSACVGLLFWDVLQLEKRIEKLEKRDSDQQRTEG
jgi:hypothetical protein